MHVLLQDIGRLDKRVGNLESHFHQAEKDIREIGFHRTKSPNAVSGSRKSKLARLNLSCRRILRKFRHPYNHFKSLLAP